MHFLLWVYIWVYVCGVIEGNRDKRTRGSSSSLKDTKNKEVVYEKGVESGKHKDCVSVCWWYIWRVTVDQKEMLFFPQAIVLPTCLMAMVITLLAQSILHISTSQGCVARLTIIVFPISYWSTTCADWLTVLLPHLGTAPACRHAHVNTSNKSYIGIDRLILLFVYPSLMQCARMFFPSSVSSAAQITQLSILPPSFYENYLCLFFGRILYNIYNCIPLSI